MRLPRRRPAPAAPPAPAPAPVTSVGAPTREVLGQVLEGLPAGVLLHDASGRLQGANAAARALLGLGGGARHVEVVDPDGGPVDPDAHPTASTLRTGAPAGPSLLGLRGEDGTVRWLTVEARPLPGGGVTTSYADVPAQAAPARVDAVVAASAVAVFECDLRGRLRWVNPAWSVITGLDGAAAVGTPWTCTVHPAERDEVAEAWVGGSLRGGAVDVECRVTRPDGTVRWVIVHGRVLHTRTGDAAGWSGTLTDVTERREAADQLVSALAELHRTAPVAGRADTGVGDRLTGLPDRPALRERLEACADGAPAVVVLDMDRFRAVNEEHGHRTGDAVLVTLADRLLAAAPPGATVARTGGVEFAVLLPGPWLDDLSLRREAERLRAIVRAPVVTDAGPIAVEASVGCARTTPGQATADALLDAASHALSAAKRRGRAQTRLFAEADADAPAVADEIVRVAQALALTASVQEGMPALHADHVADLSGKTARRLGLAPATVERCRLAGWLHDVGKVAVPDPVLGKPGRLDADEWHVMRSHAAVGEQIIRRVAGLRDAALAVRHHHERWDGRGYPDGLAGEAIPVEARIVGAADAYSAITADRVYQRSRDQAEALAELRRSAGTHLDPRVVEALVAVLEDEAREAGARLEAARRELGAA